MQVLTLKQVAQLLLHAYPHVARMEDMLTALAAMRSEPSKEALEAIACSQPMTAEWDQFLVYCEVIQMNLDPDNCDFDGGVPLCTSARSAPVMGHQSRRMHVALPDSKF